MITRRKLLSSAIHGAAAVVAAPLLPMGSVSKPASGMSILLGAGSTSTPEYLAAQETMNKYYRGVVDTMVRYGTVLEKQDIATGERYAYTGDGIQKFILHKDGSVTDIEEISI